MAAWAPVYEGTIPVQGWEGSEEIPLVQERSSGCTLLGSREEIPSVKVSPSQTVDVARADTLKPSTEN